MNIRDPDGTLQDCPNPDCKDKTVIAEQVPGQPIRIHCGTYTNACTTTTSRRTR